VNTKPATVRRDTTRVLVALAAAPAATAVTQQVAPRLLPDVDLGLAFPRPTGRAGDAAAILATNGRVLGLIAGATVLACTIPATANWLAIVLATVAALNVALICLAIADAGEHALRALLPHGPLELLAYSLVAAGFLHARRDGTAANFGLLIRLAGSALVLLVLAAGLEVLPT
jgi:hypothetical protein